EIGRVSTMVYDRLGRVIQVNQAGGLTDYYAYDGLGQQIKHWNNAPAALGLGIETTDYDTQGRIISQRAFGGDLTTTSYTWDASIAAISGIVTGGWTQVTTYFYDSTSTGKTLTEKADVYGRATYKNDLGSNITTYAYDIAGRMTAAITNGLATNYSYFNTGQLARIYKFSQYVETIIPAQYAQPIGTIANNYNTGVDYSYDKLGQRLSEIGTVITTAVASNATVIAYKQWSSGTQISTANSGKNQTASYDALGRLTSWAETGSTIAPAASIAYQYDATGNIRRTTSVNSILSATGTASGTKTEDYWFRFDSMNRLVTDRGELSGAVGAAGTTIIRKVGNATSTGGQEIVYNAAGQREYVVQSYQGSFTDTYYVGYGFLTRLVNYVSNQREDFEYAANGTLTKIYSTGSLELVDDNNYGQLNASTSIGTPGKGTLRSVFGDDLMGRQTSQTDYEADGVTVAYSRTASYNGKSQLTSDDVSNRRLSSPTSTSYDTFRSLTTYDYDGTANNAASYALGSATSVSSRNWKNGIDGDAPDTLTTNTYYWRDGAVQATITNDSDTGSSSNPIYTTTFYYDTQGQLTRAYIADGKPRNVNFTNDELGQIIRRSESGTIAGQSGNPHEVWYRFGGRQMGYVGNNGTSDISAAASITERQKAAPTTQGTFRGGGISGKSYSDFINSYDPLNSYNQGSGSGGYTVRGGETLQSIAQQLYGDASLWYKIAQANGLSAASSLTEGQSLILPAGVTRNSYNASTVTPYNPSEAIGDLLPTTAAPPKKPKCGVLGFILLAAIAIAITALTASPVANFFSGLFSGATGSIGAITAAGAALTGGSAVVAGGIVGGALVGAASSIISQGIGVATKIQEKFSWKAVGLAALGGAVGGAFKGVSELGKVGQLGSFSKVASFLGDSGFVSSTVRAGLSSAITQGIGRATGLQDKFSWAGVAAASAGAAAGHLAGGGLSGLENNNTITNHLAHLGTGAVSTLAIAATRSAIEGSNFGRNILAAIPDVIGGAIFSAISNGVTAGGGGGNAPLTIASSNNAQATGNSAVNEGGQTIGEDAIVVTADLSSLVGYSHPFAYSMPESYSLLSDSEKAIFRANIHMNRKANVLFEEIHQKIFKQKAGIEETTETGTDTASKTDDFSYNDYLHSLGAKPAAPTPFQREHDKRLASFLNSDKRIIGSEQDNAVLHAFAQEQRFIDEARDAAYFEIYKLAFAGIGLPAGLAGLGVAAPAVYTASLTYAPQITNGLVIVGEGVTGVNVTTPVLTVSSAAALRLSNAAKGGALSKAEQLALNAANGRAFEQAGIKGILSHVGLGKNTTSITQNGVTTIFDAAGRPAGLVEFKDVINLSRSPQLTAQLEYAVKTGQPYNLVVSPRNQNISKPLLDQIRAVTRQVGGGVYRYDPATDILTPFGK
ncbi:putative toxin, partial [Sphingorhabdus arenilitoris]